MTNHLPNDSLEYLIGSLWDHRPPERVAFQLLCTADFNNRPEMHPALNALLSCVAASGTGRVAYICYRTEFDLPSAVMGPLVVDEAGKAIVHSTFDKKKIPAGNYLVVCTTDEAGSHLRLQTMRAAVCSVFGRAGAHHIFYEACIEFADETKLSVATNAFEVPREGFWCALRDPNSALEIGNTFLNSTTGGAEAAISIVSAALDQTNASAKLILYWSAMETIANAKRLGNAFGRIYGCSPHELEDLVPFNKLKGGRDGAAHHGKMCTLTQRDERVILGMFTDLLEFATSGRKTQWGPSLHAALSS